MNTPEKSTINSLPDARKVESRAKAVFESACQNTDPDHALRLGLARRKALHAPPRRSSIRAWAPLAGAAAAACALVVAVVLLRPGGHAAMPSPTATPVPIVATPSHAIDEIPDPSSNQMEIVEDLGFYRWLAAQPNGQPAPGRH